MKAPTTCDVCGQEVPTGEEIQAEVSVEQLMCPTSMTFHPDCYERASALWQPDDSCSVDPDFPEMSAWAANAEGRGAPPPG
ncbi:MAG: hypothetical protein M3N37_04630 [Actinomycetota bacterium]|nr:hypothetical protein [Actinomycetota bacterium]